MENPKKKTLLDSQMPDCIIYNTIKHRIHEDKVVSGRGVSF